MSAQGPLSGDQGSGAGQMSRWCSLAAVAHRTGDRPALTPSLGPPGHARSRPSTRGTSPSSHRCHAHRAVRTRVGCPGGCPRPPARSSVLKVRRASGTIRAGQGPCRPPCRLVPRSTTVAVAGVPAAFPWLNGDPGPPTDNADAGSRTNDGRWQVRAAASRLGRDEPCPRIGPPHTSPARRQPARSLARGCLVHGGCSAGPSALRARSACLGVPAGDLAGGGPRRCPKPLRGHQRDRLARGCRR